MKQRILVLAEGYSHDPHYGKTMHGVLRYRGSDVVAILDSARAGESENGVPIVGDVGAALAFDPEVALVGVATQGGRFPAAWRDLLRDCIAAGLSIENGLHEMLADDPALACRWAKGPGKMATLRVGVDAARVKDVLRGSVRVHVGGPSPSVVTIPVVCTVR